MPQHKSPHEARAVSRDRGRVIEALLAGEPAIFPTDTVYGIGVAVLHARTPQVLYDVKRRDAGKPIAWLVGGPEALDEFGCDVPTKARELVRAHWPGALTVIVRASDAVPHAFQSQVGTIGLRMPASDMALELIRAVGPIAATSANLSGGVDPQSFSDLDPELLHAVSACVEGDCPASGIASTVIDCTQGALAVLRQGAIVV